MSLSPPSENFSWGNYSSSSSIHLSEKHISVDPFSLRQGRSPSPADDDDHGHDHEEVIKHPKINKLMLFSCSIPKSPVKQQQQEQKKKKVACKKMNEGLSRQHSVALCNLERLRESQMWRSKSCGERRTCQPSLDDFDLFPTPTMTTTTTNNNKMEHHEVIEISHKEGGGGDDARPSVSYNDEKFKCCLFLPAFGKPPKPDRARKEDDELELMSMPNINKIGMVSHRASLEKFECGSWRSSAVINSEDDQDGDATSNLFFDLPVELIRCSNVNDTESPVTAGFVFDDNTNNNKVDHDHHHYPKGVLKNATTTAPQPRKSHESSSTRHVRFSTSSSPNTSPTSSCVTPRLRRARDDFNAFLEAQSSA